MRDNGHIFLAVRLRYRKESTPVNSVYGLAWSSLGNKSPCQPSLLSPAVIVKLNAKIL